VIRAWVVAAGVLVALAARPAAAGEIAAAKLEALRTAGHTYIDLPAEIDDTASMVSATLKVCVTRKGKVRSVKVVRSSQIPDYDVHLTATVKRTWRFRPYRRGKKAVAACARFEVGNLDGEGQTGCDGCAPPSIAANVTADALETHRIAGPRTILPDRATQRAIADAGDDELVVALKLSVTATGAVETVLVTRSSGFPAFDETARTTIRDSWRFTPFELDGVPSAVWAEVRVVYRP
jgi:TonB family protein